MEVLLIHHETILSLEWKRLADELEIGWHETGSLLAEQHISQGRLTHGIGTLKCKSEQKSEKSLNWWTANKDQN